MKMFQKIEVSIKINNMKKILTTLLMFFCVSNVFSQFEQYHDYYGRFSAKGMNIKGKVKKLTETKVSLNEYGDVDDTEQKIKYEYEFDKSGNLIKTTTTVLGQSPSTFYYNYFEGKISSITNGYDYSKVNFYYSPSSITIKSSRGKVEQIQSLSNGRISEIDFYSQRKENEGKISYKCNYEYNKQWQIKKGTFFMDLTTTFETYQYNKQGDIEKLEQYDRYGKLDWIDAYKYNYDKNKNWTKLTKAHYSPGDDKEDYLYSELTRIYEFY
jgi:hypothetical protein